MSTIQYVVSSFLFFFKITLEKIKTNKFIFFFGKMSPIHELTKIHQPFYWCRSCKECCDFMNVEYICILILLICNNILPEYIYMWGNFVKPLSKCYVKIFTTCVFMLKMLIYTQMKGSHLRYIVITM